MRTNKAFQESLARHPYWDPVVTVTRIRRFKWKATWKGPYGGSHENYDITYSGVVASVVKEIAEWTKCRRKTQTRVRVRLRDLERRRRSNAQDPRA